MNLSSSPFPPLLSWLWIGWLGTSVGIQSAWAEPSTQSASRNANQQVATQLNQLIRNESDPNLTRAVQVVIEMDGTPPRWMDLQATVRELKNLLPFGSQVFQQSAPWYNGRNAEKIRQTLLGQKSTPLVHLHLFNNSGTLDVLTTSWKMYGAQVQQYDGNFISIDPKSLSQAPHTASVSSSSPPPPKPSHTRNSGDRVSSAPVPTRHALSARERKRRSGTIVTVGSLATGAGFFYLGSLIEEELRSDLYREGWDYSDTWADQTKANTSYSLGYACIVASGFGVWTIATTF